ncbi:hypothetical protein LINPERHAP1_LOCUS29017 [Linum perenne]
MVPPASLVDPSVQPSAPNSLGGAGKTVETALSYKGALAGVQTNLNAHKSWICVGGNDIVPSIKNGIRTLQISKSLKDKLSVEIDLDVPLAPVIELDGAWRKVEYENIPDLCFECGLIGHVLGNCPKLTKATCLVADDIPSQSAELISVDSNGDTKNDTYGP